MRSTKPLSPSFSLRTRLVTLMLTVSLSATAIAIFIVSENGANRLRNEAMLRLQSTSQAVAAGVERWDESMVFATRNLAVQPAVVSGDHVQQEKILRRMQAIYSFLLFAHTLDMNGRDIVRSDGEPDRNYGDRRWFVKAKDEPDIARELIISRTNFLPSIAYAASYRNVKGKIAGVVCLVANLEHIEKQVGVGRIGNSGFTFVTDEQGKVIGHPDKTKIQTLSFVDKVVPGAKLQDGGLILPASFQDNNRKTWLIASSKLPNAWTVVSVQSEDEVLQSANALLMLTSTLIGSVVVCVALVTWFAVGRIVRPIAKLTQAAQALAGGDWTRRAPEGGDDEVGILARSFNVMTEELERTYKGVEEAVQRKTEALQRSVAALGASERQFRTFMNHVPAAAFIKDTNGVYVFANEFFERVFQLPPNGWQDKTSTDIFGDAATDLREHDEAVFSRGQTLQVSERVPTANGTWQDLISFKFPLRDAKGELFLGGIALDVTGERQIAEELRKSKEAAEAANRAKSAFLANMSHEIRTPMNAILGYADLAISPEIGVSERTEFLLSIRRNGGHLLRIINDILDISKIEAGKLNVERIRVPLRTLVADAYSSLQMQAQKKNLDFRVEFAGMVPETIETDPGRLRQILFNLAGNAIKFTEQGGVRIVVGMQKDANANRSLLQFSVIDTGLGLSEEQISKLFQPFTQADQSMTRRFGGTGLGLAISKRLAEILGGDVTVKSELGKGSEFVVTIDGGAFEDVPLRNLSDIVGTDEKSMAKMANRLAGKALLAEDGLDNQRIFRRFLESAGLNVSLANDGAEACEMVWIAEQECDPYDLILMDMQMPVMDGYDAVRKLRENGYDRPIIALTAHAMEGDREKCVQVGCDDYAAKPINRQNLLEVVRRHLIRVVD